MAPIVVFTGIDRGFTGLRLYQLLGRVRFAMTLPRETEPAPHVAGAAVRAHGERFAPAVVVPTYHNAGTLAGVLEALDGLGLPIVVVDDGCRDESPRILAEWVACATDRCSERVVSAVDGAASVNGGSTDRAVARGERLAEGGGVGGSEGRCRVVGGTGVGGTGGSVRRVVTHPANRGKGAALRSGFAAAAELGATHAVTIDSDGQHDAADVPALLDAARAQPRAIVIGARPGMMPGRPARRLVGLRLANALVAYECGRRLRDTQSGLRVYPLEFVTRAPCSSERFSYETETLIRAVWDGRPVIERPINCRYFPRGQRVSHWRPVVDTVRDVRLHSRMLVEAVMRG